MLKDFKDFLMKGNVLDLAVAVIIAGAFALVIKAFVDNILMPIVSAIIGQPNFDQLTITAGDAVIGYGFFLTALVNFVLIAAALFLVVKAYQASQKNKAEEAETTEVDLLAEIRDLLARERA